MTSTNHGELAKISAEPPTAQEDQAYLRLWFALARRPWKTLVLVPSHPEGSADEAARMFAAVGERVSGLPVRAITMSSLDYGAALALADLQERIRRLTNELGQASRAIEVPTGDDAAAVPNWVMGREASEHEPKPQPESGWEHSSAEHPPGVRAVPRSAAQFVIAIPCLISEPLGLSATQGADAVVVLVELGRTKLDDVRRIVEQVGRDRVAGCILVK
jgi:hypothetical protein